MDSFRSFSRQLKRVLEGAESNMKFVQFLHDKVILRFFRRPESLNCKIQAMTTAANQWKLNSLPWFNVSNVVYPYCSSWLVIRGIPLSDAFDQ